MNLRPKTKMSRIERQTLNLSWSIGLFLIAVGLVMKALNFFSSSYSFGTRQGLPYTEPAQYQTINWRGTIFIGIVCIAFGLIFKLDFKKDK